MKATDMARLGAIIDSVQCTLLNMRVVLNQSSDGAYAYVQVHGATPDALGGSGSVRDCVIAWTGRKWLLSVHMTETEVVNTCLLALTQATMHELHEAVTYQGKQVYDPHVAVWHNMGLGSSYPVPRDVRSTSINGA